MLFDGAFHDPLDPEAWSSERARAAIRAIGAEAEERFDPNGWWPVHPLDETAGRELGTFGLKIGAAGVLWALDALERRDLVQLRREGAHAAADLHARYLGAPKRRALASFDRGGRGLWFGDAGVLLVAYRLAPSPERADGLFDLVAATIGDETNCLIGGSPGTMLAAKAMADWTGEERWRRIWLESAEQLWREWRPSSRFGCRLWGQQMDGRFRAFVGSIGLAGNVGVLAHGRSLLGAARAAELERRAVEAVGCLAVREDGLANWAPWAGLEQSAAPVFPVQWCHGAPGVICWLSDLAPRNENLTGLLLAGGELAWRAGPLAVGAFLCCGTVGNGFAFLKLFRRTGDERWLERARAFAMHAIRQVERQRSRYGQGRFSLWTGDVGTALYLAECLEGTARFPTIDYW